MRLLLKTKKYIVKQYWVAVQTNSISGWFSGEWLKVELGLPSNTHFDSHFTFPKDGNFHFTYNSINDECEEFVNVYWDKVKIKMIKNGEKTKIETTREEFNRPILTHLVSQYQPEPLDKIQFFQFPLVSFNVYDGDFKIGKKMDLLVEEKSIENDDLVVDVSQLKNSILNICSLIRHVENDSTKIQTAERFSKSVALPNSRFLELVCDISSNAHSPS